MADQAITALPKKTYSGSSQIASTDYLLGIDSAEGYQMLIQDLGEYIINKATASLAGSTQTLASAISALNSNIEKRAAGSQATYIPNNADLDTYLTFGLYCSGSAATSATLSHAPITVAGFLLEVKRTSNTDNVLVQEALVNGAVMQRFKRWHSNNGWTDWIEEPNRSEIETLNSNLSSLYCREYSYAAGTSYKAAVTDVLSKLGSTVARYWVIITIGTSRLSLMIIKDGVQWSNGILTSYAATGTEVYFVMSRASGQSAETVVYLRKLLTGDLEQ